MSSKEDLAYHFYESFFFLHRSLFYACNFICRIGGNFFSNSLAPHPPPYMPSPPSRQHSTHNNTQESPNTPQGSEGKSISPDNASNKKKLTTGPLIGIVLGSTLGALCITLAVILLLHNVQKGKDHSINNRNDTGRSAVGGADKGTPFFHKLFYFFD